MLTCDVCIPVKDAGRAIFPVVWPLRGVVQHQAEAMRYARWIPRDAVVPLTNLVPNAPAGRAW
jgi:hypothetical protein